MARKQTKIDPRYKEIGRKIRDARGRKITQQQLAEAVDLSRESIANIESGRQQLLIHHALEIAKILHVQITDILPGPDLAKPDVEAELESIPSEQREFIKKGLNTIHK